MPGCQGPGGGDPSLGGECAPSRLGAVKQPPNLMERHVGVLFNAPVGSLPWLSLRYDLTGRAAGKCSHGAQVAATLLEAEKEWLKVSAHSPDLRRHS